MNKIAHLQRIPRVVFGTTSLGNLFVQPSHSEKSLLVGAWLDSMPAPIAIDSAGKYGAGLALEVLGRELKRLAIDPNQVLISNKLGWRRTPLRGAEPTFEPGVWMGLEHDAVQEISYKGIRRCWEEGCELLGTYTAQMLSVHDPDEYLAAAVDANDRKRRLDDIVAAYEALYELRMQGKAQSIGIGCKDWHIVHELDSLCRFDWVMFANSYTVMSHPEGLIRFMDSLAARGIAIINSAVLHGGFLSGGDFFDYKSMHPEDPADAQKLAWRELFQNVCHAHDMSPFHVAVAYGLSHPGIQSIALSTSRSDRVPGLVHAANTPIPLSVWKALIDNGLIDKLPYQVTSSW